MKAILLTIVGLLAVLALGWGIRAYTLEQNRFFAPKEAEMRREVFENTPSFVHGKAQYISRLKMQYEQATTEAQRNSLKGLILHEASTIDQALLPNNLQHFLNTL